MLASDGQEIEISSLRGGHFTFHVEIFLTMYLVKENMSPNFFGIISYEFAVCSIHFESCTA